MPKTQKTFQLARSTVQSSCHACCLFPHQREEYESSFPFVQDGLDAGTGTPDRRQGIYQTFDTSGAERRRYCGRRRTGQLEFTPGKMPIYVAAGSIRKPCSR